MPGTIADNIKIRNAFLNSRTVDEAAWKAQLRAIGNSGYMEYGGIYRQIGDEQTWGEKRSEGIVLGALKNANWEEMTPGKDFPKELSKPGSSYYRTTDITVNNGIVNIDSFSDDTHFIPCELEDGSGEYILAADRPPQSMHLWMEISPDPNVTDPADPQKNILAEFFYGAPTQEVEIVSLGKRAPEAIDKATAKSMGFQSVLVERNPVLEKSENFPVMKKEEISDELKPLKDTDMITAQTEDGPWTLTAAAARDYAKNNGEFYGMFFDKKAGQNVPYHIEYSERGFTEKRGWEENIVREPKSPEKKGNNIVDLRVEVTKEDGTKIRMTREQARFYAEQFQSTVTGILYDLDGKAVPYSAIPRPSEIGGVEEVIDSRVVPNLKDDKGLYLYTYSDKGHLSGKYTLQQARSLAMIKGEFHGKNIDGKTYDIVKENGKLTEYLNGERIDQEKDKQGMLRMEGSDHLWSLAAARDRASIYGSFKGTYIQNGKELPYIIELTDKGLREYKGEDLELVNTGKNDGRADVRLRLDGTDDMYTISEARNYAIVHGAFKGVYDEENTPEGKTPPQYIIESTRDGMTEYRVIDNERIEVNKGQKKDANILTIYMTDQYGQPILRQDSEYAFIADQAQIRIMSADGQQAEVTLSELREHIQNEGGKISGTYKDDLGIEHTYTISKDENGVVEMLDAGTENAKKVLTADPEHPPVPDQVSMSLNDFRKYAELNDNTYGVFYDAYGNKHTIEVNRDEKKGMIELIDGQETLKHGVNRQMWGLIMSGIRTVMPVVTLPLRKFSEARQIGAEAGIG